MRGDFAGVHVAPESTADVPDTEEARLVLLHPQHPHAKGDDASAAMTFVRAVLESRGSAQRTNRNMLVALAPDTKRLEELDAGVREYLAWSNIAGRVEELNLSPQQQKQVETRLTNADQMVALRLVASYIWAIVPVQPDPARPSTWEVVKAEGSKERLAERTSDKLRQSDLLRTVHGARVIRQDLEQKLRKPWEPGHISVGELWSYCCRYPYLACLRDRRVLDEGVLGVLDELTWELEGFALADGYDEGAGAYRGLAIPHEDHYGQVTDRTLLVHPTLAKEQRDKEREAAKVPESGGEPTTDGAAGVTVVSAAETPPVANTRFFGVYKVDPERYSRDLTRLSQEVLQHLAAVPDAELEVTVEITARAAGFPDNKVRVVNENAKVLKFDPFGFEND